MAQWVIHRDIELTVFFVIGIDQSNQAGKVPSHFGAHISIVVELFKVDAIRLVRAFEAQYQIKSLAINGYSLGVIHEWKKHGNQMSSQYFGGSLFLKC